MLLLFLRERERLTEKPARQRLEGLGDLQTDTRHHETTRPIKASVTHRRRHAKERKAMSNEKKNSKAVQTIELTSEETKAEQLALALAKAGMHDQIETALVQLGLAVTADEHEAARPKTAKETALALAASLGLNLAMPAKAGKLALNLDSLAKAVEKYGKHAVIFDSENGTSICTHYMLNALANTGRVSLSDTLAHVRQYKPTYSSTGHYNTIKAMLKKAGYKVAVSQGFFSISA